MEPIYLLTDYKGSSPVRHLPFRTAAAWTLL